MERASLLIEGGAAAGRRIDFLFNPNQVVLERVSGIRDRTLAGGRLSGRGDREDPLVYTGGGETRLTLKLLFDTTILPSPVGAEGGPTVSRLDVRRFTQPLWEMAEGSREKKGPEQDLPRGRLLWGKAWNLPVAVLAIAERLDRFEPDGTPLRSWVHVRFRKLPDQPDELPWPDLAALLGSAVRAWNFAEQIAQSPFVPSVLTVHHIVQEGDRLDRLAARYYGGPWQWRIIALANGLDDPGDLAVGSELLIPASEELPAASLLPSPTAEPSP